MKIEPRQLGQVLDVHVDEAEIVILEFAALPFVLLRRRQAAQAFRFEDAIDGIAVEMRQEVRDDEGQIVERKAGRLAQSADDGPLFLGGFPGQLVRPAAVVPAVLAPRSRHLRMVSVLTLKRWASTPVGSVSGRSPGEPLGWCGLVDEGRASVLHQHEKLGAASHRSAKYIPQSRNAPGPNNVPPPNN